MKEKILKLRDEGLSYREIEKETGINRGSIAYYLGGSVQANRRARLQKKRKDMKLKAIEYKGGKCVCCGFDKFPSALEFHHLDPNQKERCITSSVARNHSFKRLKEELDKTILVCANCHRGIHSDEIKIQE